MKVQKYEIARVIDKLKSIVQKNDQFPALGGILVKDGYLIASNSEITMKVKLEASKGSYFIIPMKAFDLIKNLPDGEIDISATDKNVVMIKIGAIKNKYQSYPPEEFNGVELNGKKIMEANIPMQHTIELMKNKNQLQQKVVEFIKNADLYMDNFEYVDMDKIQLKTGEGDEKPDEKVLDIPENIMDQIRLVSTYKGVHVPSMMFDSTGTKKIAAIASYVIEALEQGRILVVDELDSSIHFKLTRAIVAMFNNELNTSAQMIFTVHDINLMDCKRMFRKEQIWFVHKDEEGVFVYSLADFTAQQGVRDTTDVMEKYRKGALGALPDPELINSLLSIKGNVKGDDADAK